MRLSRNAKLMSEAAILLRELKAENERLKQINLDLGRYCLSLLEGMIVEMNDPGTLPEGTILHAASDMADQVARMEEHTV